MSFQGDVAGIGLGELLQGLARGGREGVLTLRGDGGRGATLGLEGGQIFLLPEPGEDPEIWRKRCERAWVKDPNQRIDVLRMSEIAYAARIENVFGLLESEEMHFRFEPGPLPQPTPQTVEVEPSLARAETGTRLELKVPVHCPGISVEFLLLEYARLADEYQTLGVSAALSNHDVPRLLDTQMPSKAMQRFWLECDGMSNLGEIADRLGWPIRQCRSAVTDLINRGLVRLSHARELLVLAQTELGQNHFSRAGSRLSGWCLACEPGPPPLGDVQLLMVEWQRGKLPAVLASMEPREARTLLKRLELVESDVKASIARWQEVRKYHRHDTIAELRLVQWQLRSENDADAPAMSELMKLARKFQESNHPLRAGVMLRAAASRLPETTSVRLELGTRMLAVGLVSEGTPWIVEACRTLIDAGMPEKAVSPLRAMLAADPVHREARTLLGVARNKTASGKRHRRNSIVGLALLLVLALAALVKVRVDQGYDRRLGEISDYSDQPAVALEMLAAAFPDDDSARIASLRRGLTERLAASEQILRDAWLERYKECQLECTLGDPQLGLQRALDLPPPPVLRALDDPWPTVSELLTALAQRVEESAGDWSPELEESPDNLRSEQRLLRLVGELSTLLEGRPKSDALDSFQTRLTSIGESLRLRDEARAQARHSREARERVEQQDMLLGAARAHAQAGDLARAVQTFQRLTQMEGSERIAELLAREIAGVEAHYRAEQDARKLALEGRHEEARARLAQVCVNPREHLLPWRIQSEPTGARVRFADGSTRVTPFVMESSIGERLDLNLELAGHETRHIVVEDPADMVLTLHRVPARWWQCKGRVEAMPVSVGDDYVVTSRAGEVARIASQNRVVWKHELETLGGVARTPVFLPRRAGCLLALTEDGAAWLIEAEGGRVEGPWDLGAPPVEGPQATATGVVARFRDGKQASWENRLKPEISAAREGPAASEASAPASGHGSTAGLAVLRKRDGGERSLDSPWAGWTVAVDEREFHVRPKNGEGRGFSVRRDGEWSYVAWEAPKTKAPNGRLWVSDGAGLRAFEP